MVRVASLFSQLLQEFRNHPVKHGCFWYGAQCSGRESAVERSFPAVGAEFAEFGEGDGEGYAGEMPDLRFQQVFE